MYSLSSSSGRSRSRRSGSGFAAATCLTATRLYLAFSKSHGPCSNPRLNFDCRKLRDLSCDCLRCLLTLLGLQS